MVWQIWYHNVPHTKLAEVKGHQNWVKVTGEFLTFPGGGTQFIHGALHYIDFLQQVCTLLSVPNDALKIIFCAIMHLSIVKLTMYRNLYLSNLVVVAVVRQLMCQTLIRACQIRYDPHMRLLHTPI